MKKVLLLTIAVLSIVTSCNEDLLNTKNPNQTVSEAFYTTLDQIGTSVTAIYAVLQGNQGPLRDIILLNAGAALLVAGKAQSLREGVTLAAESVDSGKAKAVLDALVRLSHDRV